MDLTLKQIKDDVTWRYLIIAPTMETIDEWFRALQERIGCEHIIRVSPEFYAHDPGKVDLGRSTFTGREVPQFMNKMMFILLHDVGGRIFTTFSNNLVVDHTSGNTFYIRSKSDPRVFWQERCGKIYASQWGRTRFRICINDKKHEHDGKVMIPSDSISITLAHDDNAFIGTERGGGLIIDQHGLNLTLGDFNKIFVSTYSDHDNNRIIRHVHGGEEWELVA
ncbi:hypothetical protein PHISCL_02741 [Aspergillus sclerotialis]|uniref:PH domain-containing protein n=1 Tax=Aspergillus sclerotialis TaxID=2070753 RepID=A0A3A2ZNX1_9EURO|nr:hypothetical protein PHISCL_02741 [Aspergillus sclerotialis]